MHIALLIANNRYATTCYFAKGLQQALERQGVRVSTQSVQTSGIADLLDSFAVDPPDWTLSFSDLTCAGQSLGNVTQIPHFSYLLDPSAFFTHHMEGSYSSLSCVDRSDVEFVKSMGFEKVHYLPHAVEPHFSEPVPWHQREHDLVYFGSCLDLDAQLKRWQEVYTSEQVSLLQHLARQALMTPLALWEILMHAKVPYELFLTFYQELDHYVRAYDRIQLLASLPAHRLEVWGDGPWQRYLPHVRCYPSIEFPQTLQRMQHAKVVVNSSVRFKQGFHERIFHAFAASTLVLTSYSPDIAQDFSQQICYWPGEWEKSHETILKLEQSREDIISRSQEVILQQHSWDQRASQILTLLKQWH
ncbi:MAG: glycosyltransferase [Verrucomicrobia bacterium]|nr:glycosyltransferase [Verrucomicrobiota bacterium]MBS0645135.1 glycosyltransferase [Verrucomicrobiota bacterium]